MTKSIHCIELQPEQSLQKLMQQYQHLVPVMYQIGLHSTFGEKSIREVAKEHNLHEAVLLSLLEVCIDEHFRLNRTLPAYGLLQLSEFCRMQYPYLLTLTDKWIRQGDSFWKGFTNKAFRNRWKKHIEEVRHEMDSHYQELIQTALPHINEVYELYYSPDYTAGKSNLFSYSLDFFPSAVLPVDLLQLLMGELNEQVSAQGADLTDLCKVYDFCHFVALLQAQERVERLLLKPLILQMEDSIVSTLQKKKCWSPRRSFLNVPEEQADPDLLSAREQEVLRLVAQGLLNKEIADSLFISPTTVISHRKHIVEKLGIHSLAGLTVYAYTHGYLEDV
jgi:DNA-binding CsgD family transcriptional regulator